MIPLKILEFFFTNQTFHIIWKMYSNKNIEKNSGGGVGWGEARKGGRLRQLVQHKARAIKTS